MKSMYSLPSTSQMRAPRPRSRNWGTAAQRATSGGRTCHRGSPPWRAGAAPCHWGCRPPGEVRVSCWPRRRRRARHSAHVARLIPASEPRPSPPGPAAGADPRRVVGPRSRPAVPSRCRRRMRRRSRWCPRRRCPAPAAARGWPGFRAEITRPRLAARHRHAGRAQVEYVRHGGGEVVASGQARSWPSFGQNQSGGAIRSRGAADVLGRPGRSTSISTSAPVAGGGRAGRGRRGRARPSRPARRGAARGSRRASGSSSPRVTAWRGHVQRRPLAVGPDRQDVAAVGRGEADQAGRCRCRSRPHPDEDVADHVVADRADGAQPRAELGQVHGGARGRARGRRADLLLLVGGWPGGRRRRPAQDVQDVAPSTVTVPNGQAPS